MEQNQYRMYVDGNTVRKAEALPKDDRQERIRREREEQRARNRKIAKRNQARELRMSRRYVAFLAVAVSITCLVCAAYVHLQADITTRMSNISALEKEIADLVEVYLKNENYNIYKFYDSDEAIKCIDTVKLDCAILDVMIKGKNGFEICQYIRNKKLNFPIIMLTAKIENQDKITGLTLGADDYITKPFNSLELVARVKSAIRRYKQYNNYKTDEEKIYIDGLEICKEQHKCLLYDKEIDLTPIEFDILLYLASKKGEVVSSEELFEKVWKEKYLDNNNTVMVHIRRIREKLKEDTKNPKYIKTVWGVGYKIE